MAVDVLLARHGQTDWNIDNRLIGQADVPLNELGRRQAEALARRLATFAVAAVYASDLCRASETAQLIATARGWPVTLSPALREAEIGPWEGFTWRQVQDGHPQVAQRWGRDPDFTPTGARENTRMLCQRVVPAMDAVIRSHSDCTIAVVTHSGPLRCLVAHALGLPLENNWRFSLAEASLSIIRLSERGYSLVLLNDTSHLSPILSPPA